MNIEELRDYCLRQPHATEDFPFHNETLAFKVGDKMFALTNLQRPEKTIHLKCNPERAVQLRTTYPELIFPGYHMNKKHWNTLHYTKLPERLLKELIDHSYKLVVAKLSEAKRNKLKINT